MKHRKPGVEAVDRALLILRAFSDQAPALTLTEIAEHTGLYKSTVLRLTESLEAGQFLVRGADLVYRPGPELWRVGTLFRRELDLASLIRPALEALVDATGETASFYIRVGDERVCLYRQNSRRSIRHHLDEGIRLPLGMGAAGRVLTAFNIRQLQPDNIVFRQGYCVSLGERDPEVGAVAVPVFDASGNLRGALSVSGVLARFDQAARQTALDALRAEAQQLMARLTDED
jgi:DNA-binding IclR family transcriptional regulator